MKKNTLLAGLLAGTAILGATSVPAPLGPPVLTPGYDKPRPHTQGRRSSGKKNRRGTPGAFGNSATRPSKVEFLAASSEAAKVVANRGGLRKAYRKWFLEQTPETQAEARALGLANYSAAAGAYHGNPTAAQAPDVDFHDPADLPAAADRRTPVDVLEPEPLPAVGIEGVCPEEIRATVAVFSGALEWAFDVSGTPALDGRLSGSPAELVAIGRRAAVLIASLRPDLADGLEWNPADEGALFRAVDAGAGLANLDGDFADAGLLFGRALEWVRRGASYSALGERLYLLAYVLRPVLIGSPTLDEIGRVMNKSRQAMNKLVQCLRDTFGGLKNLAMRGESTRARCRDADRDTTATPLREAA